MAIASEKNNHTIKQMIRTLTDYTLDQDPTDEEYIITCATYISQTPTNTKKYESIKDLTKESFRLLAEIAQHFAGNVTAHIIDHLNYRIMQCPFSNAALIDLVKVLKNWEHKIPVEFDESEFASSEDDETSSFEMPTRQKLQLNLQRQAQP